MSVAATRATVKSRSARMVYIAPAVLLGVLKKLNARSSTTPMMRIGGAGGGPGAVAFGGL